MKVFISMGFRGRTDEEVIRRRSEILRDFRREFPEHANYLVVIDNFVKVIPDNISDKNSSVWCLGDSIRLMAESDYIIFDSDFNKFRGCNIEHTIAKEYCLRRLYRQKDGSFC